MQIYEMCLYNVLLLLLIVHGGIGEDGTLQSLLDAEGVPYTGLFIMCTEYKRLLSTMVSPNQLHLFILFNLYCLLFSLLSSIEGPGAMASKICMDKVATSVALKHVCVPNLNMFSVKDKEHSSYITFLNLY